MPNSYEKDGIVFFEEPYRVKRIDWIYEHLDCDSIILGDITDGSEICIVCYATSEKYNDDLSILRDEKYRDCLVLVGVGHEEINCI